MRLLYSTADSMCWSDQLFTKFSLVYDASQGLLQLQAWVWVGFYTRAADFY